MRYPADRIFLCDVVKAELCFGSFKSTRRAENLALRDGMSNGCGEISHTISTGSYHGGN
jgi:hypothetical protein